MKPKNKFQQRVFDLSKKLPPITKVQVQWGYANCIEHIGRRTSKGIISCLECGHSWQGTGYLVDTLTDCNCPNCNTKLTVQTTRKRVFDDYQYLCVVTSCEEFQVLRFIYLNYRGKAGEKAQYFHSEVIQLWIAPNGKHTTIAKLRPIFCFTDIWNFSSSLEIRPNKNFYNATPTAIYPRQKLIPEIRRSGFKRDFYGLTPFDLFHYILTGNKAETLLKAGQIKLLQFFAYHASRDIADYWASIRICIRNSYQVKDATLWFDYIDNLRFFGKDLHNARYVCPSDLHREHDRYMIKKAKAEAQKELERPQEKEKAFRKAKAKFFDLMFSDGTIHVGVLESIEEIIVEGKVMHHCVGDYYSKNDSLILSACISNKKIETIEVSLSQLKVIQSRGICNKDTEYHDRIIRLVESNIPLIEKRLTV